MLITVKHNHGLRAGERVEQFYADKVFDILGISRLYFRIGDTFKSVPRQDIVSITENQK